MTKPTDIGLNRTGVATSPVNAKETIEGAREGTPIPSFDPTPIERVRTSYAEGADPMGTMPPPSTLKGAAKALWESLRGKHPNVLLDLLGERLAFERTGTRLYEALFSKLEAAHPHPESPTLEELEAIRDDELAHVGLCVEALEGLGADATVVTPAADIATVASMGLVQVICDPRTTLTEALKTILIAELTDNEAWETLARLAGEMGHGDLAARCQHALAEEQQHLRRVRHWVHAAVVGQAGVEEEVVATT